MITRLIVKNLNGKHDFDLTFHPDINIFIGKNGSGKTTLMKLIWGLLSGNIAFIFSDKIHFDYLKIEHHENSYYELSVDKSSNQITYTVFPDPEDKIHVSNLKFNKNILEENFQTIFTTETKSLFFPTFRRIEGGFGLNLHTQIATTVQDALSELFVSFEDEDNIHKFITYVSTVDIVDLLKSEYANTMKVISNMQEKQTKFILDATKSSAAIEKDLVTKIKKRVEKDEKLREILQKPFTELSQLVRDIFNKGIKITKDISVGDEANAISADKLSSGEKQMLSFFAYNMFYKKAAIFIDEPEISLHTDWQKVLFPSLIAQGTENQFFVATHSPFIYAKYPDKTFNLSK